MGLIGTLLDAVLPARRVARETGVRPFGRDELDIAIGDKRFWVYAELSTGAIQRVVHLDSVKDISGGVSPGKATAPWSDEKAEVQRRVKSHFEQLGKRVKYVEGQS